jgi:hypothetical protein
MGYLSHEGEGSTPLILGTGIIWLATVLVGMGVLWRYASAAADPGAPPPHWPAASALERSPTLPTLVMVIHPHCPCSRASLGELAVLMAHADGRVAADVVFVRPEGVDEDWANTDLWRTADAIPGVRVVRDDGDVEARRFGAETSGETLLYGSDGHLLFAGGITAARGHAGDNRGRRLILDLLDHQDADREDAPVFGCHLFDPIATCTKGAPRCES